MKTAFVTAVTLAALTFSGIARADLNVSETINGTVAGNNGITNPIDYIGDFGPAGADLTGAAVSLTFTYDYTEVLAGSCLGCGADNGDVTESVTINNQTVSVTSNFPGSIGGVADYLGVPGGTPPTLIVGIDNSENFQYFDTFVFGAHNLPLADVGDQAAVNAFIATPGSFYGGNEYVNLSNAPDLTSYDSFNVINGSSATTPEPTLWMPVALGLGGIAVLKSRRRRAQRG
jgi:hypothetical protein